MCSRSKADPTVSLLLHPTLVYNVTMTRGLERSQKVNVPAERLAWHGLHCAHHYKTCATPYGPFYVLLPDQTLPDQFMHTRCVFEPCLANCFDSSKALSVPLGDGRTCGTSEPHQAINISVLKDSIVIFGLGNRVVPEAFDHVYAAAFALGRRSVSCWILALCRI
jgi:hypothetical protein